MVLLSKLDHRRVANGSSLGRDILQDHGISPNERAMANSHAPQYFCASTNIDPLFNGWRLMRFIQRTVPNGYALPDDTIVTDHSRSMNNNAMLMLEDNTSAEPNGIRQLYPIKIPYKSE